MILPQTWEYEILWELKKAELQPPSPKSVPKNGDTRVWLVLPHVLTGSVISLHAGGHWCMAVVRHVQVGHMWPSPNTSTTITLSIHVTIDRSIRAYNPHFLKHCHYALIARSYPVLASNGTVQEQLFVVQQENFLQNFRRDLVIPIDAAPPTDGCISTRATWWRHRLKPIDRPISGGLLSAEQNWAQMAEGKEKATREGIDKLYGNSMQFVQTPYLYTM